MIPGLSLNFVVGGLSGALGPFPAVYVFETASANIFRCCWKTKEKWPQHGHRQAYLVCIDIICEPHKSLQYLPLSPHSSVC